MHSKFHPLQLSSFCGTRVEAEQEEEDNDGEYEDEADDNNDGDDDGDEFFKEPLCNISHFQSHTYFGHNSEFVLAKLDPCRN